MTTEQLLASLDAAQRRLDILSDLSDDNPADDALAAEWLEAFRAYTGLLDHIRHTRRLATLPAGDPEETRVERRV